VLSAQFVIQLTIPFSDDGPLPRDGHVSARFDASASFGGSETDGPDR